MKLITSLIILVFILAILASFIFGMAFGMLIQENAYEFELTPTHNFTTIQPEHYFKGTVSPISVNDITKKITIDYTDDLYVIQTGNTGSMRPALGDYAELIISPNLKNLQVGDIAIYPCKNITFLHRIVRIENGIYTMKGDNNHIDDYKGFKCNTTIDKIVGKVVGVLYAFLGIIK